MKRLVAVLLVLSFGFSVLAGCAETSSTYDLGQAFTLKPGQSAKIESEDLTLKFEKVLNDSRCPVGVTCIWEGQIQCLLTVKTPNKTEQITLTLSGSEDDASQLYGQYRIEFNVTPYPVANETISANDYRLELRIFESS